MKKIMGVLGVVFCLMLAGCASQKQDTIEKRNTDISKDLTYDHSMELEYAKMFAVDYYQNDYALVTIADDGKYLIVPEGAAAADPEYLSGGFGGDGYVCGDRCTGCGSIQLAESRWLVHRRGEKSHGRWGYYLCREIFSPGL